jgi:hypothetical protein
MLPTPATARWSSRAALTGADERSLEGAHGELPLQGLATQPPGREVRVELSRLEQLPGAEAPDIAVGDVRSVV